MKTHIIMAYVMGAALTVSTQTMAQQRVEVNGHIDVVSDYVWRGMDQNYGFSVQPALGLAYKFAGRGKLGDRTQS